MALALLCCQQKGITLYTPGAQMSLAGHI